MEIQIAIAKKQELSEAQKEYRKFVKLRLKENQKKHPFEGTDDEIAEFLDELSTDWKAHKEKMNIETKE